LTALQECKTIKSGPDFQQLKLSCSDIGQIYYRNIASKLGNWLTSQQKLEEVEGIFAALTDADRDMVAFTYDHVVARLDDFVRQAEKDVERGAMNDAEEARLQFKAESREVTERLEKFSGELPDLVILFAGIARVPVTLATS
jgi:predicted Zn-dependent protease with MMP-like domain